MKSNWARVRVLCFGLLLVGIVYGKQVGQKQREDICLAVAQLEQAMETFDAASIRALFSDTNTVDCIELAYKVTRQKERFIKKGADPADFEVDISVHGVSVVSNMYLACGLLHYGFDGRQEVEQEAVQILFNNQEGRYTVESISCPFNAIRNQQAINKNYRSAVSEDDNNLITRMSEGVVELFGPAGAKSKDKHLKNLSANKQDEWFDYIADNGILDSPNMEIIRSSKFGDIFFVETRVFQKSKAVKNPKGYLVLFKYKNNNGEMALCEAPVFLGRINPNLATKPVINVLGGRRNQP